jgi:TolB protein
MVSACSQVATTPLVAYLAWDANGRVQLFRAAVGEAPEQLTGGDETANADVTAFSLSPQGDAIIYSLLHDAGGSEIRRLDVNSGRDELLLDCPQAECGEFAWSPDNTRLVYERRELSGSAAELPHLWWLNTHSGETIPLIDDDSPAYGANFSPDAQWLAYVSPQEQGVVVVNLLNGDQRLIASETGMPPRWSPDSTELVYGNSDVIVLHSQEGEGHDSHDHDYGSAVHLFSQNVTVPDAPSRRLSPDLTIDDSAPVFSPDGEWLIVGRRAAGTAAGRQLWIMRPDGSEARALTDDDVLNYGSVSWSPDGRRLLYQRYPTFEPDPRPSIWTMDVMTGEMEEVWPVGFLPQWLTR